MAAGGRPGLGQLWPLAGGGIHMLSVSESQIRPPKPRWAGFPLLVVGSAVSGLLVTSLLAVSGDASQAQLTGDFAILIAAITAAWNSAIAARQRGREGRAWLLLAAGLLIWTTGQAIWTFYGITRDHEYPFPSLADVFFVGYSLPAAAALFVFPRPRVSRVALFRSLLDVAVIAGAVLFIS